MIPVVLLVIVVVVSLLALYGTFTLLGDVLEWWHDRH